MTRSIVLIAFYALFLASGFKCIQGNYFGAGALILFTGAYIVHREKLSPLVIVKWCPFCWLRNLTAKLIWGYLRTRLKANPALINQVLSALGVDPFIAEVVAGVGDQAAVDLPLRSPAPPNIPGPLPVAWAAEPGALISYEDWQLLQKVKDVPPGYTMIAWPTQDLELLKSVKVGYSIDGVKLPQGGNA